jgi:Calcineurin-like phosphoesterase
MQSAGKSGLLVAVASAAVACTGPPAPPPVVPAVPADRIGYTVFLLGDAGVPAPDDPVLAALHTAVAEAGGRATVLFMGDNVYPAGLPVDGAPDRSHAEERLRPLLEAARGADQIAFVPGNHDWDRGGPDGWEAIRRQAAFIAESGVPHARLLPDSGCPGPAEVPAGPLRLAVLDTQWWLHDGPKPRDPTSPCPADTPGEVVAALRDWLVADTTRPAIVVGHHPLLTGGAHGGYFEWTDHLFPLTNVKPWLWLPLPILGSAYPLARSLGISKQDLSSARYRAMRDSLAAALAARPALVYASGHEHNLQVLDGDPFGAHTLVVSGSAAYGRTRAAARLPEARYARRASGFVRLDVVADGGVRLAVIVVDRTQGPREDYSEWLVPSNAAR